MKSTTVIRPNVAFDLNTIDVTKGCNSKEFLKKIALYYSVEVEEIEFFNGEEALFHNLLKYHFFIKKFSGQCYLYAPCTRGFEEVLNQYTNKVELINRLENIDEHLTKDALVIFTNPSTPDGKYHEIEKLLTFWQERNATIIVDESFFDFYNGVSASSFINQYPNLYVMKSMTYFYHMQGVKFATLISNCENIKKIKAYEHRNKLSSFDTAYINAVVKDRNFKRITQAIHAKNIILLEEVLQCSGLFEVIHSTNTNFVLAKLKKLRAKKLQKLLMKEGISIEEYSHIKFLDQSYVGFEVYSEECIKSLIQAFQKILGD